MRKLLIEALTALGVLWSLFAQSPLHAQQPVYPGSYSTPANGNGLAFVPYSMSNPLPVTGSGGALSPSTKVSSAALAANLVVNAAASHLVSFDVSADSTLSAAAWWVMVYDASSAPADGAVTPAKCYAMASGTTSYSAAFTAPVTFGTGIVIGVSTTGCFTKTASTHAFISGDYQ